MSFSVILLDDEERNQTLLKSDPLFHRLTEYQKIEAINKADNLGREASAWLQSSYTNRDARVILEQMGVDIITDYHSNGPFIPFSVYREKNNRIILYVAVVEKLVEQLIVYTQIQHQEVLLHKVTNIILFHELFHHLEATKYGSASKLVKVPVITFGIIKISTGIQALSEIGAHTFARECVGPIESYLEFNLKEVMKNGL